MDKLTRAAMEVLAREGFAGLTIRMVAGAAGVGTATAYTYFSSKQHLVAEIFWRRIRSSESRVSHDADPTVRVLAELRGIALLVADEQELSGAVTSGCWAATPMCGICAPESGWRSGTASPAPWIGEADPETVESLELLYAGALMRAGMGYES